MDDLIVLIQETYTQNSFSGQVPAETETSVWASIRSATRSEWEAAGQNGINPSIVIRTPRVNYNGEKTVEVGGQRYGIYRTYFPADSDEIELYCEEKVGTNIKED